MKTVEEMKASIHAFCLEVCKEIGPDVAAKLPNGMILERDQNAWSIFASLGEGHGLTHLVVFYPDMRDDDGRLLAFYVLSGLSERDAVEAQLAETVFWERKFNEECEAHINSIEQYGTALQAATEMMERQKTVIDLQDSRATKLQALSMAVINKLPLHDYTTEKNEDCYLPKAFVDSLGDLELLIESHKKGAQDGK